MIFLWINGAKYFFHHIAKPVNLSRYSSGLPDYNNKYDLKRCIEEHISFRLTSSPNLAIASEERP
jgi:hypothetical protein